MSKPSDESPAPGRPRRERSTRYPGVSLPEGLKLCESIDSLGLDGLSAAEIASALGYKNIKTNTFSARLSAARQFGLLNLTGDGYALTPLARAILHPVEPDALPRLHRQAFLKPPLYAELAERLAGKRVPDVTILGNILYHNHHIIATSKRSAAEAFLESARFAGALSEDQMLLPDGAITPPAPSGVASAKPAANVPSPCSRRRCGPPHRRGRATSGSTCGSGTPTRGKRSASAPRSRSRPPASSASSRRSGSWSGSRTRPARTGPVEPLPPGRPLGLGVPSPGCGGRFPARRGTERREPTT